MPYIEYQVNPPEGSSLRGINWQRSRSLRPKDLIYTWQLYFVLHLLFFGALVIWRWPRSPYVAVPKRDLTSASKRDAESSVVEAVSQLLYRNDTMCLGLAICQDARDDAKSASLLKEAFSATDFLRGVNFAQYAVAQANFPQETCEQAFQPCETITPTLQKALIDVKNAMEPLAPSLGDLQN